MKRLDKITGVVTNLAGTNSPATVNAISSGEGVGTNAQFCNPTGVAADNLGGVYVSDADANQIFTVASDGTATVIAGQWWMSGSDNGVGTNAQFTVPAGLAYSSGFLYVADSQNNLIRKIDATSKAVSTVAGQKPPAAAGHLDGAGTAATFKFPAGVAVSADALYVSDTGGYIIRKIVLATGAVTTLAGVFNTYLPFTNGIATSATFYDPQAIAVDSVGTTVYVADSGNNKIRKIAY